MIVVDSLVWIVFFNDVSTPEVERLDRLLGATWPPPADCSVRCHCCRCGLGIKAAPFLLTPANDGLRLTTTPLRRELIPNKGSAISTGAIEANQILRGWIKFLYPLLAGKSLQISYRLAAPLAGITTTCHLQIAEGLPVFDGADLEDLEFAN